jgi:hypothetical protein
MAEDNTYQGAVRRHQDNNKLEIGSTGSVDNYGSITNITAGTVRDQVATAVGLSTSSTGAVAVSAVGIHYISSTGSTGSSATFTLAAPAAAGIQKTIIASNAAAGKTAIVTCAGSGSINYTKTYHNLTFNAKDEAVVLQSISTTKWIVSSNVGSVALTT